MADLEVATPSANDCKYYPWGGWSDCSRTCGTGYLTRTRVIKELAKTGGKCGRPTDIQPCNTQQCPVDCKVSDFSVWSHCSQSCSTGAIGGLLAGDAPTGGRTGSQWRSRSVERAAAHSGTACPPIEETRACNTAQCPVNCDQTDWGDWLTCSKDCGGGVHSRTRTTNAEPSFGGIACGRSHESHACNTDPCPIDCVVEPWHHIAFGACSVTCGSGTQTRSRNITTQPQYGGVHCAVTLETASCNTDHCPIDCIEGDWEMESDCSRSCGQGTQTKTRPINRQPHFGGKPCGHTVETTSCNTNLACPVDCTVGLFETWSACSVDCSGGTQTRTRAETRPMSENGKLCPHLSEVRTCNTHTCAVDCVMGNWTAFSGCSRSCGTGTMVHTRAHAVEAQWGGAPCVGKLSETDICETDNCPVDCETSAWSGWTDCTRTCGTGVNTGIKYQRKHILRPASPGGVGCGSIIQNTTCHEFECPVDCVPSGWNQWGTCTATCGSLGVHTRTRVYTLAQNGGLECTGNTETAPCNTGPCPINCTMSDWQPWSVCSKSCNGIRHQERTIQARGTIGGARCGVLNRQEDCNTACPEDCQYTAWTPFDACTETCGRGIQYRTRTILAQAKHNGLACGLESNDRDCNTQNCPVDCVTSDWTEYDTCTRTCGGGKQTKYHSIDVKPAFGGADCPMLLHTRPCNFDVPCPTDCVQTPYSTWTACTKSCGVKNGNDLGAGTKSRFRSVITPMESDGTPCGNNTETVECPDIECPVDCVAHNWTAWAPCVRTCGGAVQKRTRGFDYETFGGKVCGHSFEERPCGMMPCPVDCDVSNWITVADSCSKSCGGGTETKTRTIDTDPVHGGKGCPMLTATFDCNPQPCPVDCVHSAWTAWGYANATVINNMAQGQYTDEQLYAIWSTDGMDLCSESCGTGQQRRYRTVAIAAAHGGAVCTDLLPAANAVRTCTLGVCPVDCTVTPFNGWTGCSKTCGGGTKERTRSVVTSGNDGGFQCPELTQTSECFTQDCPVDCVVPDFHNGTCSHSCGDAGVFLRTRTPTTKAMFGGKACPSLSISVDCNRHACPIDCQDNGWSGWTTCSKDCIDPQSNDQNAGKRTRYRNIIVQAAHGGQSCSQYSGTSDSPPADEFKEESPCNAHYCAVDCVFTVAAAWTTCTEACGTGYQRKAITVTTQAAYAGIACPTAQYEQQTCNTDVCAVDCLSTGFNLWSPCTKSCGAGTQYRQRGVARAASVTPAGAPCTDMNQTRNCEYAVCPIDCNVGGWSDWSSCTLSCGTGTETRTRNETVTPNAGGKTCPHLSEARGCNTKACPIDCEPSDWNTWMPCTKSCGTGTQMQTRHELRSAAYGGKLCGALREFRDCNTQHCPVDCALGDYTQYTPCSKTCAGGFQQRSRSVSIYAQYGGTPCTNAKFSQVRECNSGVCPTHCETTEWGPYGECSKTCGSGLKTRARTVTHTASAGGYVCPSLTEQEACSTQACAHDCALSEWVVDASCSATCGTGTVLARRSIIRYPLNGGKACGRIVDTRNCNTQACPINCILHAWDAWGRCSRTCGAGTKTRGRSVNTAAAFGGIACHHQSEMSSCNNQPCAVDCKLGDYVTEFSAGCTKSCGGGTMRAIRPVLRAASHGGRACGSLTTTRYCNQHRCPIDCVQTVWTAWSICTASCSGGMRERHRSTQVAAAYGGKTCDVPAETGFCNNTACPTNCEVASWQGWEPCTADCGGGTTHRIRTVSVSVVYGGLSCPTLEQTKPCNTKVCPIDCQMQSWSDSSVAWTTCTRTCGSGQQQRARKVIKEAAHGGAACGQATQHRACNEQACPIDCVVDSWGALTECSKSCGWGWQSHTRHIVVQDQHGGVACTSFELVQQHPCTDGPTCPVHCAVSPFAPWSSCTKTCGLGAQTRTRIVTQQASGGHICPYLSETRGCNSQSCAVDCVPGTWPNWADIACSHQCGGGLKTRTRTNVAAQYGGVKCGRAVESLRCNAHSCPIPCVTTDWIASGACSVTCGTGTQREIKTITQQPRFNGAECNATEQTVACTASIADCPVDCVMESWSSWTACSKSCGDGGTSTRSRSTESGANYGGVACGDTDQSRACNAQPCPADCDLVSDAWGAPSTCTASCGGGQQSLSRTVANAEQHGGKACGATLKYVACNMQSCPIDCDVTEWRISTWVHAAVCNKTCGTGYHEEYRSINVIGAFGGIPCPVHDDLTQTVTCNTQPCAIDCAHGEWSSWTACTKSCGSGTASRSRNITTYAEHGGLDCVGGLEQLQACAHQACPTDCIADPWQPWTECTKTCGTGYREQTRAISLHRYGGKPCVGGAWRSEPCNTQPCAIDCVVTLWSNYNDCSKSCGVGNQFKVRNVLVSSAYGGKTCPTLVEHADCNSHYCPQNCEYGQFSEWSACSKTCEAGVITRHRSITAPGANGGIACVDSTLTENVACNLGACPINCVNITDWSEWSACDKSCNGGTKSRTRHVNNDANTGTCPDTTDSVECNSSPCAIDCEMESWTHATSTAWTSCSKTCGTGEQTRSRERKTAPQFGGRPCAADTDARVCETQNCPIDCEVESPSWANLTWTPCSKSCGGGLKFKNRSVKRASAYGGKACPSLETNMACMEQACPEDCTVTEYGSWATCSKTCGGGAQSRSREVTHHPTPGGAPCPELSVQRACNQQSCDNIADHFYSMDTCSHVTCAAHSCSSWGTVSTTNAVGVVKTHKKCLTHTVTTSDGTDASSKAAHLNHIVVSHKATKWVDSTNTTEGYADRHGKEQNGESHLCRWEYGTTNDCVCKCFNKADFSDSEIARRALAPVVRTGKTAAQDGSQ